MIKVLRLFNDERLSPQSYCKCVYQPGEDSSIYMYVCALPSKISPVLKRERARSHTTHILNCKSVVLLRYFFLLRESRRGVSCYSHRVSDPISNFDYRCQCFFPMIFFENGWNRFFIISVTSRDILKDIWSVSYCQI